MQLPARRLEHGPQVPGRRRVLRFRHRVPYPGSAELARDRIRLHKKEVAVENGESWRSIAHRHSYAVVHSCRGFTFAQAVYCTVDERMDAFEAADVLLREVALSLGSVHASHEDRRFRRWVTPETQGDGVSPALRLHDFP